METTIIIPHYRNGKITAYAVSQYLKFKKNHSLTIIIGDNSQDESIRYLAPFMDSFIHVSFPKDKIQSHGVLIDEVLKSGLVKSDYFITAESDSFPINEQYLDYYEKLTKDKVDAAGSVLSLSGGTYLHPCGAIYKKSNWDDAKRYCDIIPYTYFPNISMVNGFASHLMVHDDILNDFISEPEDYIELSGSYKPYSAETAMQKAAWYRPVVNPFHNGCGKNNESIYTYGLRTIKSESNNVFLDNRLKLINRIGAEPGQWFSWYLSSCNKNMYEIPTEIKWMEGRINEQQEYTINEAGIKHIWAGSSYLDMKGTAMNDVYEFKHNQIEELYNSLPEHQKINQ